MIKKIIKYAIIFIALLAVYLYYEDNFLGVTRYNIISEKIPEEFNNYKIVQISDYHNVNSKKLNKDLIKNLKKEKPNIIVITGDSIDSNKLNMDVTLDLIDKIKEIAPIYFVTGNHETAVKKYKEFKEKIEKYGVTVLDNKSTILELGDSKINLLGVDDPRMSRKSSKQDAAIINKWIKNIEYEKELYTILLSHRPELFSVYVENEIDLVLTGHAHGGQIRIPFIGGVIAPHQGFFPKYTSGLFTENNTNMIISRGIGNSMFPFRVNNRPELIVVNLKTK